jgi:hypothetical protein
MCEKECKKSFIANRDSNPAMGPRCLGCFRKENLNNHLIDRMGNNIIWGAGWYSALGQFLAPIWQQESDLGEPAARIYTLGKFQLDLQALQTKMKNLTLT